MQKRKIYLPYLLYLLALLLYQKKRRILFLPKEILNLFLFLSVFRKVTGKEFFPLNFMLSLKKRKKKLEFFLRL
ncbi:MAG: hypothetical protein BGO67_07410 [Alphaproteobacteria bacterium 41-28]|nr:MAG: hypothetical protein BGO67_07410 [Alphaproteobacteria bacterium 41-28]